ncbi:lysophospholipid acyltransferase family protein [Butyrivibrio sp. MB2005]|uniref:lysophospholipid acyltransferase family protein n=1 Tax=Butyrivibrio sp. MB2005 TaxID=1280678 RepID=UPI000427049A|nr:lysophospholipid acyltransferase family protein [Butyrivibrio sp. MB2005]
MFDSIHSFKYMLSLSQQDCEAYCREKRLERYQKYGGGHITNLPLHSFAHKVFMPFLKASLYMEGKRLNILRDDRIKTDRPIIFCPTHIGGVDIEMSFLSIQTPCWLVLGDPREFYRNFDGFLLQLNGVIVLDVLIKEDRKVAKAQMKELLRKGGNLLLFPEGVQNISPNALINPLFAGAVDLAIDCGADIVPIALCRRGDSYYSIIGENICYEGCQPEERDILTNELRNRMATLKWEIIEKLPQIHRENVKESDYDDFVNNVLSLDASYTWSIDDIKNGMYHPKDVVEHEDVFDFAESLVPNKDNAFLFDKRLIG